MENGALEGGSSLGLKAEVRYPRLVVVAGFGADWMELQVLVSCRLIAALESSWGR